MFWSLSDRARRRRLVSTQEIVITTLTCVSVYTLAISIDAAEWFMAFSRSHEAWQLDEVLALMLVLGGAFVVFAVRRWHELTREIAARNEADARTRQSEHRFATAFAATPQPTLITESATGRVIDANTAFAALTGYERSAILGRTVTDLQLWHRREHAAAAGRHLADEGAVRDIETEIRIADGSIRQVTFAAVVVHVDARVCELTSITDVTSRKTLETQLAHQAFHDSLTGLANRALFRDRAVLALARRERHPGSAVGVLFLDLDDFKRINDGLGHAAGDSLLKSVAGRLIAATRQTDTVARLGGDEFAVLLELGNGEHEAMIVAERVSAAFRRPVDVLGRDVSVAASIGLAVAAPGEDCEALLRNADVAMYEAKARGKSRVVTFEPSMGSDRLDRLELESGLQHAIHGGELRLVYQPIVDLESGQPRSVEALVRWEHPTRGTVPPLSFIPIAEETGLILPLGRWVLIEACRNAGMWQSAARRRNPNAALIPVTVNVSGRQLLDASLLQDVRDALESSGIAPEMLVLEITESVLIQDTKLALEAMHALKALGVRLAIDDFGTGYSSLNYLREFPVDVLKIDRSFIKGVASNGREAALTRTIIALGEMLSLTTVAEGVESAAQRSHLQDLGCSHGQGYLFARPVPPEQLAALLGAAEDESADMSTIAA